MKNQDKKIHEMAAHFIVGNNINTSIKGNKDQLHCLQNLLEASKNLYVELNGSSNNLDKVMTLVENKKRLSDEFLQLTGIDWKL